MKNSTTDELLDLVGGKSNIDYCDFGNGPRCLPNGRVIRVECPLSSAEIETPPPFNHHHGK